MDFNTFHIVKSVQKIIIEISGMNWEFLTKKGGKITPILTCSFPFLSYNFSEMLGRRKLLYWKLGFENFYIEIISFADPLKMSRVSLGLHETHFKNSCTYLKVLFLVGIRPLLFAPFRWLTFGIPLKNLYYLERTNLLFFHHAYDS